MICLNKIVLRLLLILYLCLALPAYATNDIFNVWSGASIKGNFAKDATLFYRVSTNLRFQNQNQIFRQNVNSFAFGDYINQNSLFAGGFELLANNFNGRLAFEYRLFEQYEYKSRKEALSFSFRNRIEQRRLDIRQNISLRMREKFGLTFCGNTVRLLCPKVYSETFFLLNHPRWVGNKSLDQQRTYLGFIYRISKQANFEFGYLNQYVPAIQRPLSIHILSLKIKRTII